MIHSFRLSTGAVSVVSALAIAGLAPGLPAPARAADGQPMPVRPRTQPVPPTRHFVEKGLVPRKHKTRKTRRPHRDVRGPAGDVRGPGRPRFERPEVDLDLGGPEGPLIPGRTYDWPYSVTNTGTKKAEMVTFVAPVPSGLEYVSGQGNCSMQGGEMVCLLGTLDKGQTFNGVVTTKVSESAKPDSTVTGTAGVNWTGGSATGSFPAKSVSPASDLVISKSGPADLRPGQQIVYTLTVENRGPSAATGVTATTPDAPAGPAGAPVTVEGGKGCAKQGGDGLVCALGTLNAHESKTFNVIFKAPPRIHPGLIIVKRFEVISSIADLRPEDNHTIVRPRVIRYLPTRHDDVPPRPLPHRPHGPWDSWNSDWDGSAPGRPGPDGTDAAPASSDTIVSLPDTGNDTRSLPNTGGDAQSRVDLALALVGVGLVLVGVGARRRRSSGRTR